MTLRRITRDRRLTPEEATKYKVIREQVAGELPELIARHQGRVDALSKLQEPFTQRGPHMENGTREDLT